MNDDSLRIMNLATNGYRCSQILVALALEEQDRENEDLLRAMSGLLGGMGCGKTCGALTGGCSVLGLYAGWGTPDGAADEQLHPMLVEFVNWFEREFGQRYGGIDCSTIVQDHLPTMRARCPEIVSESFARLKQILADHHYELDRSHQA